MSKTKLSQFKLLTAGDVYFGLENIVQFKRQIDNF